MPVLRVHPALGSREVTPREAEVLDALTERLTNAEIAERLVISVRTVESHVSALIVKLGAPDRRALAAWRPPLQASTADQRRAFVGRRKELDRLALAAQHACAGRGGMVLIGGAPGIGKTRLALEAATTARSAGMAVYAGHHHEISGSPPYVAFVEILEAALARAGDPRRFVDEVLRDAAPEIARLMPGLRRRVPDLPPPLDSSTPRQRRFLFECLVATLDRIAAIRPSVLILDDLQWADDATLRFLNHLAPRLADLPVLVVATYRDADVSRRLAAAFADLHRARVGEWLRLPPLDHAEVADLVAAVIGSPPPAAAVSALLERTDGNPFFVEEVLRDLSEADRLLDGDGQVRADLGLASREVPEGVRLVVQRRLDRMRPDTREFLLVAAVAGRSFSLRVLTPLVDVQPDRLIECLEEALAAALLTPGPGGHDAMFSHELVRQALRETLSVPRRRRVHARLADSLIAVHADHLDDRADEICHHLLEAGEAADPAALRTFSLRAGRNALRTSAYEEALVHLDRALAMVRVEDSDEIARIHSHRARALRGLQRVDDAAAAWRAVITIHRDRHETDTASRVSVTLGRMLAMVGRQPEAISVLREALTEPGPRSHAAEHSVLSALISAYTQLCEIPEARRYEEMAEQLELPDGMDVDSGSRLAVAWHAQMRCREGAAVGTSTMRAPGARSEPWSLADAMWGGGWCLVSSGRFAEADVVRTQLVELAGPIAHPGYALEYRIFGVVDWFRTGDAHPLTEQMRVESDRVRVLFGGAWICHSYSWLGTVLDLYDETAEAQNWLRRGAEEAGHNAYAGWSRASLLLHLAAHGQRPEALRRLAEARAELGGREPAVTGEWGLLFAIVEAGALLDALGPEEARRAQQLITAVRERTGTLIGSYAPGQLLSRVAGVAAAAAGDLEGALRHYAEASDEARRLPHVPERLLTQLWSARARRALGDGEQADDLRRQALAEYRRLGLVGAARLAERIDPRDSESG